MLSGQTSRLARSRSALATSTAVVPASTMTVSPGMISSAARWPIARLAAWLSYMRAAYGVSKLRDTMVTAPP